MKTTTILLPLCFSLLLSASGLYAQPVYQWAFKAGTNVGSAVDIGECIARTPAGNYVVSGIFRDVVDFDPSGAIANRTSLGVNDIFIAEYNEDGNYNWAISFGSLNNESIKAMALDAAGNIYVTGQFNTSCDFNLAGPPAVLTIPGGSTSTSNIYVAKYDALGNYVWAISIGGTDQEVVNDIALDEEGNIYITGDFYTTADFDPSGNTANLTSSGGTDIFFAKYDNNGNYLWAKRIGNITTSNLHDSGRGIRVDPDGNIILAGYISFGTVDMDPDPAHTGHVISPVYQNSFIAKYDPNGNYIWARGMGSNQADINQKLELDTEGNIYLGASFYTDATYKLVDYDPDPGNADYLPYFGQYDIVLAKYDNDGNYQWAKSFGSSSSDGPNDIEVDAQGNVYLAGYFILTVDFDPSPGNTVNLVSAGGSSTENGFIAKYTSSGEYISAMSIPSPGSSQVKSIALDHSNNVFTTGSFAQTTDFDPHPLFTANTTHVNNSDVFVAKYFFPPPCEGLPNQAAVSPAVADHLCGGIIDTLFLTGLTPAGGYSYQWQYAPSASGPWTNAQPTNGQGQTTGSGTFSSTWDVYVTPRSLPHNPTWYRCVVTCLLSGQTTASAPAELSFDPLSCHCTTGFTQQAATALRGLTNVTLTGETEAINNTTTANTAVPPGATPYTLYTTPAADLKPGEEYSISTTVGTANLIQHHVAVWIDLDRSGSFGGYTNTGTYSVHQPYNASGELERIITVGPTANVTTNSLFTIPSTAKPGLTAMRVRYRYGASLATWGACQQITGSATAGGAGEVEDYRVMILSDLVQWTGSTSSDWNTGSNWSSGSPPGINGDVLIPDVSPNHQPVIDGESPVLNTITVEEGAILTIAPIAIGGGNVLSVNGELVNEGEIRINNGASLLQGATSTVSGSGIYKISRQGLTGGSHYNFWSSPVGNSNISLLGGNRYYYHTPSGTATAADDTHDPGWKAATGSMAVGKGYASTGAGHVTFNGIANNYPDAMPLQVPVTRVTDVNGAETGYNLVGNPFPSAIDPVAFLSENASVIEGTIWLWNQSTAPPFSSADYATINHLGATAGGGGQTPEGYIPSCQGFFVNKTGQGEGTIVFKNSQRSAVANTQFFDQDIAKAWLGATAPGSQYTEILVGFTDDATEGFDRMYDGRKWGANAALSFYSLLDQEKLAIQGLPPLQADRRVQLGYTSNLSGLHEIRLKEPYGFPAGTLIFLEDTKLGTLHNLMLSEIYRFHWVAGDPEKRFILHFYPAPAIEVSMALCEPGEGSITLSNSSWVNWQAALHTGNAGAAFTPIAIGVVALNGPEPAVFQQLSPGLYSLTFIAPDGYTFVREVMLAAPPQLNASFSADPETVTVGEPVLFTAQNPGYEPGINWDFGNGTTTGGIASLAYIYEQPGLYTVSLHVTAGPCLETESKLIRVTEDITTSVASVQYNNRITAFPNPAGDWLTVVWNHTSIPPIAIGETVRVSDSFGRTVQQIVLSGNANGNSVRLDLRGLAEGIYLVSLENEKERSRVKIMVNGE